MEKELKYIITLLLLFLCGCKKWVAPRVPNDRTTAASVFETDARATSAVTAIYANMINGPSSFANSLVTLAAGLSADELQKLNPSPADQELMDNVIGTSNGQVATLWKTAYQSVYYANTVLDELQQSSSLSRAVKDQLTGEAKFIRAFCYAYLVSFFGDVPLVITTDYTVSATTPRAPAAAVYNQVVADLQEARDLLPEAYPGVDKNRPNKWAAAALLARMYLYGHDWVNADNEASAVISAGLYTPLQALNTVFLKNSREAIWQLSPTSGMLKETATFRPAGSPLAPQYFLAPQLVNSLEPGDGRRTRWIDSVTYLTTRYYYPAKYRNTTSTVTEYYTVLRAAELYLIRAEARLQQGRLPEAVMDLNIVRTRASLAPLLTTIGQPQVRTAIEQERRAEFMAEWGHRWFDLVRWDRATDVLAPVKPLWSATDTRYPVPQDEINSNPFLTQNPGY